MLTFFYPWYQHFNWDSERLLDRPAFLYSTDLPDEVARSLSEVRKAGLDGVIVSWRGDTDWNDRRLQIVLDQAQKVGLTVSILVETLWATEGPEGTVKPFSLDKMRLWLAKAYKLYGRHPAFLRTGGRPVIFVYVADAFTTDEWRTAVQSLKRSRRSPFLMADTLNPAFLESFDGAFTYGSIPPPELKRCTSDQALVTKSYNLARGGERTGAWMRRPSVRATTTAFSIARPPTWSIAPTAPCTSAVADGRRGATRLDSHHELE